MCDINKHKSSCNYLCSPTPVVSDSGGPHNLCGCPKHNSNDKDSAIAFMEERDGGRSCGWVAAFTHRETTPKYACDVMRPFQNPSLQFAYCGNASVPPFVAVPPTPVPRDGT